MKNILLVIDSEVIAQEIMTALTQHGYSVTYALNANDALRRVRERLDNYDLICTKVMMPYFDGVQLMKMVRDDSAAKHLPFVFLSAPPNEKKSFLAWRSRTPRYWYMNEPPDVIVVLQENPPSSKVLLEDIIAAIDARFKQADRGNRATGEEAI